MNFQLLNKQRKFILFFSLIGFIAMFLPWISLSMFGSTQNINGMHGRGIVVFLCFIAGGLIAVMNDQQKKLDKTMWMVSLIISALALIITFSFYSEAAGSILGSSLVGVGIYLAGMASIGILLSTYIMKAPEDNLNSGFNSLKASMQTKIASFNSPPNSSPTPTITGDPLNNINESDNMKPVL